jgi:NitT/TauT family transport system ATP-binding protein
MSHVRFEAVEKTYSTRAGPVHALAGASFDVEEGSFVSVVGTSGCGKSTLLKMCAGLIAWDGGDILVDGKSVHGPQMQMGIAFQDALLLEWRTVLANVLIQMEARRLPRGQHVERAKALLERVGVGGFDTAYPNQLSGGMRQRVALCRALIHDPQMLLLDEPFGALDALTRDQLVLDLSGIWFENKKTAILVTHSISEAVFLSDKVVVMSRRPGTVQEEVPIDIPHPRKLEVRARPEFGEKIRHIQTIFQEQGAVT